MKLKQDEMTSRERLQALSRYQKPDRVPLAVIDAGFCASNAGFSVTDVYDDPVKSFQAKVWAEEQYGLEPIPQVVRHTVIAALDFGGEVLLPRGEFECGLKVKKTPVQTEADVLQLTLPDSKTAGGIPFAMAVAKLQEKEGFPVWFRHRSPFTMAVNLCEMERFGRWMFRKPELCGRLLQLALDHVFNVLDVWIEAFGPEKIFICNSSPMESNQMISPKHFERFALPGHYTYFQGLKIRGIKKVFLHICGDQNKNLPMLAESRLWDHPAILSFGHEVELKNAARHFPEDIIYGNINPVLVHFGTPQDIYQASKEAILNGKDLPGGFILGTGCDLPYGVPPINVFAMTRAVHDLGWYE